MKAKASMVFSVMGNLAVIALVGYYLFGGNSDGGTSTIVTPLDLADDAWLELTATASVIGDHSSAARIVEFLDYECSYCAASHQMLQRFLDSSPGTAVAIRHFPLPYHEAAEGAARAAICAEAQGAFQRVHNALLEDSAWQSTQDWKAVATGAGVQDLEAFATCLDSAATQMRLDSDRTLAASLGVRATPTFVGQTALHRGSIDRRTLILLAGTP